MSVWCSKGKRRHLPKNFLGGNGMFNGLMSCNILGKVALCIAIFPVLMDDWRRKNGGGNGGGGGGCKSRTCSFLCIESNIEYRFSTCQASF
jgi:hypothetical protein